MSSFDVLLSVISIILWIMLGYLFSKEKNKNNRNDSAIIILLLINVFLTLYATIKLIIRLI